MNVRDAIATDLPRIVEIYNSSIPGGWSTADTQPVTVAERMSWFHRHDPKRRPIWVGEVDSQIVGWVSLEWFYHARPAYDATAEISTYIAAEHRRLGYGLALKKRMIEKCPEFGVTTVVSMYFDHNLATRRINAQLGFEEVGHLPEIACVQGVARGLAIGLLRIPGRALP